MNDESTIVGSTIYDLGKYLATALTCAAALAGGVSVGGQEKPAAPQRYVVTGCVSRAGDQFLITDPRGEAPTVYRIEGDRAKLEFHVGHTVEIAGPIAPIPQSKGAKTAPDAPAFTIKAETLTYISTACTNARRP